MRPLCENDQPSVLSSLISPQSANVSEAIADNSQMRKFIYDERSGGKKDSKNLNIISHDV